MICLNLACIASQCALAFTCAYVFGYNIFALLENNLTTVALDALDRREQNFIEPALLIRYRHAHVFLYLGLFLLAAR